MKLMGKLDRKPPAPPDIEDCGKSSGFSCYQVLRRPRRLTKTNKKRPQQTAGRARSVPQSPGTRTWAFRTSPENRRRSLLGRRGA